MKTFGIIVCLVLTAFQRLSAQTVVEVRAESASMLIGEQVHLQVKCTTRAGAKVTFPTYQPQQEIVPGLEVVENGNIDTLQSASKQVMTLQRSYTVTAFDSALYTIPPFKVNVDGKEYASRGSIGLKVSTVAVDTVHVDKFNGPHDVVELPLNGRHAKRCSHYWPCWPAVEHSCWQCVFPTPVSSPAALWYTLPLHHTLPL